MTADLSDCTFHGPALPAVFVRDRLPLGTYAQSDTTWDQFREGLRGGSQPRVHASVTARIAKSLGYQRPVEQPAVHTRHGAEAGGYLLRSPTGATLRAWSTGDDVDFDTATLVRTQRDSATRIAQRVLHASGETAGLVTNGEALRVLLCDASRADSHVTIDIAAWRRRNQPPDSFRLLHSLVAADTLANLPRTLESARLHQVKITKDLRRQAREAIVGFINALPDRRGLPAQTLWRQSLILVYRLLFILKLEASDEAGFSFASTAIWSSMLSPNQALGPLVRRHLDQGHQTGEMLEAGLRLLFAVVREGLACSELRITALGGGLFKADALAELDRCVWGDHAVALLLDRLIWTTTQAGERARVHYGCLGTEELGAIYESLLEQEPAIAHAPLRRIRKGKLESVVPAGDLPADIDTGAFFLRTGTGRKSSGSYYTPRAFVRFIVGETLARKIEALSPTEDPHPARLLTLRIVDPGMGSGHFLVEACRFLADALLSACLTADERGLADRISALPDPENSLSAYLPSRGWSEPHARAICRRLVAVHCLYGCDRNPLAVELARLSLWLESYAEGLPLTFLDHRLVHGDALTGPFFETLKTLPVTGGPLDPLLAAAVTQRMDAVMVEAGGLSDALNASLGRDTLELERKQAIKQRLDQLLSPLRQLARAWSGAAMLSRRDGDDIWLQLASHVANHGAWPTHLTSGQQALLDTAADALPWDLVFPEAVSGFAAVIGNPPWDVLLPNTAEFLAGLDPALVTATATPLSHPEVAAGFAEYRARFDRTKRLVARLFQHQRAGSGPDATAGSLDMFRLFAERAVRLTAADGSLGLLLPSAFHANEGATGIRQLYLRETDIAWCLSFENRRRVFDIDSRFKFDAIIAHRPGPTRKLRCAFYLERIEDAHTTLTYDLRFLQASGGANLTPLELRSEADLLVARAMFASTERVGHWCARRGIRLGSELHMSADASLFQAASAASLTLHEGKTFHQYTDRWNAAPRYSVAPDSVRPATLRASAYYRLAFRDIARATDERTMIACIAPPGTVFGHTASVERAPWQRPIEDALTLCAVFNSFAFDWLTRQKAATHLSLYILDALPMPNLTDADFSALAEGARQLTCRNSGYDALRSSLGPCGRPEDPHALRTRLDAIVARGYGLSRELYRQVLSGFSHRSWPDAPAHCLTAFDALTAAQSPVAIEEPV